MLQRLARRQGTRGPAQPGPPADPSPVAGMPARGLKPRAVDDRTAVTDLLYARLTEEEIAAVEQAIEPGYRWMWDGATPEERRRVTLSFGLLYGVGEVGAKTGLSSATPPPEVHSMTHGWVTEIGGSYYLADMVYESMRGIGSLPVAGSRVLDFSCSSGRVVRPLAAALPEVGWLGCDPNAGAIDWMRANVPAVDVSVSPATPPLPFDDASLDLVYAISVWSHYSAAGALVWLEELHRVVRPGGHVLLTTHGLQACVWFTNNHDPAIAAKLGPNWIHETAAQLQHNGHCFWDVFGETGDWGVVDAEWGLAFFTPEWLLESLTPSWSARSYRVGGAHGNQDVYVLERR
jgi:SAM-dependent methyltransferase